MASLTSLLNSTSISPVPTEFMNTTLTAADLVNQNEWVVISNDANTSAVVEDIIIDDTVTPIGVGEVPAGYGLFNGSFQVSEEGSASGHEVVGRGQELKYVLDDVPTAGSAFWTTGIGPVSVITSTTNSKEVTFVGNLQRSGATFYVPKTDLAIVQDYFDAGVTTFTPSETNLTIPTMSQPHWFFKNANHAFYHYYNNNNGTTLYRSVITGGVLGAWTTINADTYAYKALDYVNQKVYWGNTGAQVWEYDMVANTSTQIGTTGASASSYTCSAYCNGRFYFIPSTSYPDRMYTVEISTGTTTLLTLSPAATLSSTGMQLGVSYDPNTDIYQYTIGYGGICKQYYSNGVNNPTYLDVANTRYGFTLGTGYIHGDNQGNMYVTDDTEATRLVNFSGSEVALEDTSHNSQAVYTKTGWISNPISTLSTATQNLPLSEIDSSLNLKLKVSGTKHSQGV